MRIGVVLGLAAAALLASTAWAGVTARVYLADEKTPLPLVEPNVPDVYRDIMVGTRLTILISSEDTFGGWQGFLLIPWEEVGIGVLSARDYNDTTLPPNYVGSFLEAAGSEPSAIDYNVPSDLGFNIPTGLGLNFFTFIDAIPGDWFVFDYHANAVGKCNVEYWHCYDVEDHKRVVLDLLQVLSFSHVPSRDFDDDGIVNLVDFAPLALQWGQVAVPDPNMNGSPDLNADSVVDVLDMAFFSDYWLERTDVNEPDTEPNVPAADL